MRVCYFVHDLNDPGVARRVAMLRASRLDVVIAGFWRGAAPPRDILGSDVCPLGRTFDARFVQRGLAVLRHAAMPARLVQELGSADLYLARSFEMLVIAVAVKRRLSNGPTIVYECADIHRLLLSRGPLGVALRAVERALLSHVELLIVTSPAFEREYFAPLQLRKRRIASVLLENKLLQLTEGPETRTRGVSGGGRPWRIGWFGMIRCRKSFEILAELAKRRPDLVEVVIAGRPAHAVFGNFEHRLRCAPGVRFVGAYGPEHLERLYQSVHFSWAIDYFEAKGNSRWLLPNRIYEGGAYDAVALALRATETGRWLHARGIGVVFDNLETGLESYLENLTVESYHLLRTAARRTPRANFVAGQSDCDRLASILRDAAGARYFPRRRDRSLGGHGGQHEDLAEVDICICSYRRPEIIQTLRSLAGQIGVERIRCNIIVADNTYLGEAKETLLKAAEELGLRLRYVHAPANNISVARNACLDAATAHWIAFLDDDEVPTSIWLESLVAEARRGGWDAVLGPVDAVYPDEVAHWLRRGNFHSTHPVWRQGKIATAYTGNVLFRRNIVEAHGLRFRLDLGASGGEDEDFFDRFRDAGGTIGFARKAVVHERVDFSRANLAWLVRRSFRSGQTHGARLSVQRQLAVNICIAMAKASVCTVGAALTAASAVRRTRYLLRAALHFGVVAKLAGISEIRMY